MDGLKSVLIVGGGIGGMATGIRLRQRDVAVDLIDIDPEWRVYGAGITITGATLRAYRRLGLLDELRAQGAISYGTRIYLHSGALIHELDEPPVEEGLPATGGILRPTLHRIMSERVRKEGVNVQLGLSLTSLSQDATGVDVTFDNGESKRYSLVIGADGIYSRVRSLLFPDALAPRYTGQGSWRILADRPENYDKNEFYVGHRNFVGMTACAPDKVYLFILNPAPEQTRIEDIDQPAKVRELLSDFGGNVAVIRESISEASSVVFRPLLTTLQPKPWHSGRAVLIGDAAHATTPHLASGAGLAVEDALVLVEELERHRDVPASLAAFTERRFDRCKMVVDVGVAIGALQLEGAPFTAHAAIMGQALHALADDY